MTSGLIELKNVKIFAVYEKSLYFDTSDLKIPEGVYKTIYLSKYIKKYRDKKVTTDNIKKNDICNLVLKISDKFINVVAYNIIGHEDNEEEDYLNML